MWANKVNSTASPTFVPLDVSAFANPFCTPDPVKVARDYNHYGRGVNMPFGLVSGLVLGHIAYIDEADQFEENAAGSLLRRRPGANSHQ
jgi:hypothetical protein